VAVKSDEKQTDGPVHYADGHIPQEGKSEVLTNGWLCLQTIREKKMKLKGEAAAGDAMSLNIPAGTCESTHEKPVKTPDLHGSRPMGPSPGQNQVSLLKKSTGF